MGQPLPFGFQMDYPQSGGMYEQLAHAENARFEAAKPPPCSPELAKHRMTMAKLNAMDAWATAIGAIRRRRKFLVLLAASFGRQSRRSREWEDDAWREAFGGLHTATHWNSDASAGFDRAAFSEAVAVANVREAEIARMDQELTENQNAVDIMIQQIEHTARGARWLRR